jgi:hypothetical protein
VPGVILFILGGILNGQLKSIMDTSVPMAVIVANIGFVFAAMSVFIGLFVFAVGCCYTKCNKMAKCCACFVRFGFD